MERSPRGEGVVVSVGAPASQCAPRCVHHGWPSIDRGEIRASGEQRSAVLPGVSGVCVWGGGGGSACGPVVNYPVNTVRRPALACACAAPGTVVRGERAIAWVLCRCTGAAAPEPLHRCMSCGFMHLHADFREYCTCRAVDHTRCPDDLAFQKINK